ncbi:MAG: hypothetical protein WCH34_03025 [Bacteroidota bacterium]
MLLLWHFLINVFLVVTKRNYLKATILSFYHDAALYGRIANPYFADLYAQYHPIHLELMNAYSIWNAHKGTQVGKTSTLNKLLTQLSGTKIQKWDVKMQDTLGKDSEQYKVLMPRFRRPFQNGKQISRVGAVKTLGKNLTGIASLSALKAEVDAFYVLLQTAMKSQKSEISTSGTESKAVETARVAMCVAQYSNLGLLMSHFSTKPSQVEPFFDLKNIRNPRQIVFTGQVNPTILREILKHTFKAKDKLKIINEGKVALEFYLSRRKGKMPMGTTIVVQADEERSLTASELGNLADTHLTVLNPSPITIGKFTVLLG